MLEALNEPERAAKRFDEEHFYERAAELGFATFTAAGLTGTELC